MKTVQQQCAADSMQDIGSVMSSAQLRKINKPIVEKKRRERINTCLDELKELLLQSASEHESSQSKLEKADILEMTVKHLRDTQRLQQQLSQRNSSSNSSETGATSYRDGYSDCAREVATYLGRLHDAAAPGGVLVRTRVLAHLSASLRAVNSAHRRHVVPPTVPPTSSRLPVDEHCRVSTSFRTPAAVASSTTDIRLAALPAAATGTGSSHSLDGPTAAWSDTVAQRTATPPEDQKHHVTTTTLMMSPPTYDVNGNDVTTHDYPRSTPPAVLFADPKQDSSLVWRPW